MRVSLFATCLADQLFPGVAVATVKLLRHLGAEVVFPEGQTCCGQPAYNAGYHQEAKAVAKHHLEVFRGADYVVLPSGSCGAMLWHYPDLFSEDGPAYAAARALAERSFELTTFITEVLGQESIGADLSGTRVTYHDSCHAMRFMGIKEAPRKLLKAAGAELVEAEGSDVCCGFGGLFSVKMPEISAAMARAKLPGITATGARVLTSTDGGCLMQLSGTLRRQRGHEAGPPQTASSSRPASSSHTASSSRTASPSHSGAVYTGAVHTGAIHPESVHTQGTPLEAVHPEVIHIAELLWRGVERTRAAA